MSVRLISMRNAMDNMAFAFVARCMGMGRWTAVGGAMDKLGHIVHSSAGAGRGGVPVRANTCKL